MAAPIALVADFWRSRGWQVTIKPTEYAGHAISLAREAAARQHQLVLAAGGDGTLGEVANGLADSDTILGLLPVGTGNSFAKELQLPRPTRWDKHKLLQAADALAAGRVQRMDLGQLSPQGGKSGRYWMLWAGVGVDGFLVNRLEPRPKWSKKLGTVGYTIQGLAIAMQLPPLQARVVVDDEIFEDRYVLVLVSNCRLYAGGVLQLSPQAKLDDGLFEIWLFRGEGLPRTVHHLLSVKLHRHIQNDNIIVVNGRQVMVQTDPISYVQTDGEKAGNSPFICKIKPGAIRLLVPEATPKDLFCQPGHPLVED